MSEQLLTSEKKYDVGLYGVWFGCNYGSIATYFGLNKILESYGLPVLMIDKPSTSEDDDYEKMNTHSRRFANKYYNISRSYKLENMNELNKYCESFIIGSDQLWNYGISKGFGKSFYLDFVNTNKRKISYAVSYGHTIDFAPNDERIEIHKLMRQFTGISVREKDGIEISQKSYGIGANQVLDPVFLADKRIYDELANNSKFNTDGKYIATYILDPTQEKADALLHISEKLGYPLINILDGVPHTFEKNKKAMPLEVADNIEVEDWLKIIRDSQFLISDSCHGISFGIIFEKNLIPISNSYRGFSRFDSLTSLFGIRDRLVTDPKRIIDNPIYLSPINYDYVKEILNKEKKRCHNWLRSMLGLENIIDNTVYYERNFIENVKQQEFESQFVRKASCLYYKSKQKFFEFDEKFWDEKVNDGFIMLTTKEKNTVLGKYASMVLFKPLYVNKKYKLLLRFKINTDSNIINFHLRDSITGKIQIIYSCNIERNKAQDGWVNCEKEFKPDSKNYNQFMIGASQVSGENNYITFDYIDIKEC